MISVWKQCELYNFGPVREKFLHNRIHKWPIDTNKVIDHIEGESLIDDELIINTGSNGVGLAAMEFLLFEPGKTLPEINNELTLNSRKIEYLTALSGHLGVLSQELVNDWTDYESEFTVSLGSDIHGGQTIMLNAMINHLELVVHSKVGNPAGKSGGIPDEEEAEAFRSQRSLSMISKNIKSIERLYTGNFKSVGHLTGFEEFLFAAGQDELAKTILSKILECQNLIDNFSDPLSEAIFTDPITVDQLFTSLVDLLVLIKVDMTNVLGSTITFTDNDGD